MHAVLMANRNVNQAETRPQSFIDKFRITASMAALGLGAWIALSACNQVQPSPPETASSEVEAEDWSAFNINNVFPEGAGRQLVLDNCQSCHVLVPILVLPLDEAAWYRSSLEHRERVEGLSDGEFELLYEYLAAHFTPDREPPKLPPALLDSWTTY
ncbi:MAG: hypothetical protein OXJ37_10375 [Bryobacterales bacterium]|nr:hypothetical protein [Bryobacterales bacterium]MDE0622427.1 hypothetical protein [Bryobacterales bacterium]